jgi:hypothetical protein
LITQTLTLTESTVGTTITSAEVGLYNNTLMDLLIVPDATLAKAGMTSDFAASEGESTLTISGNTSAYAYQKVLRSVRFKAPVEFFLDDDQTNYWRTLTFKATNSLGQVSNVQSRTMRLQQSEWSCCGVWLCGQLLVQMNGPQATQAD